MERTALLNTLVTTICTLWSMYPRPLSTIFQSIDLPYQIPFSTIFQSIDLPDQIPFSTINQSIDLPDIICDQNFDPVIYLKMVDWIEKRGYQKHYNLMHSKTKASTICTFFPNFHEKQPPQSTDSIAPPQTVAKRGQHQHLLLYPAI
jgi:hypothetical protein